MVSYLWPVISSAPRKLPRRITITSACATSTAGVFNPYMGALVFRQSTSCSCGSDSVVCLDGSHCTPHGTPDRSDLDTGADSPALFSLVLSWVISSPLFYHPLLESLPKSDTEPLSGGCLEQLAPLACGDTHYYDTIEWSTIVQERSKAKEVVDGI